MPLDVYTWRMIRTTLIVVAVLVAMSVAADFLQPVALAVLLAFILSPVASGFEKWGLPKALSVILTLVLVLSALGSVGYVVGSQFVALSAHLPKYESNVLRKLQALKQRSESPIEKVSQVATRVSETLAPESQAQPPTVRVVSHWDLYERAQAILGPFQHMVAKGGVVFLLLFFILMQREQVQDRIVGLAGRARISMTTKTLGQVNHRLSRYLTSFAAFNATFGTVIGLGLWAIGVPAVALWAPSRRSCGSFRIWVRHWPL